MIRANEFQRVKMISKESEGLLRLEKAAVQRKNPV